MSEYKVRFGMEFEFMNYTEEGYTIDPTIYTLPKDWLHSREYYHGMQEIMSRPYNLMYKNYIKVIRNAVKTIKRVSYDNNCGIPLYSKMMIMYNGIISNGVHIHLSIYNKKGKNILYNDRVRSFTKWLSAKLLNELHKRGMISLRSGYSHHIFGGIRISEYSFKQNSRFMPVIISPKKNRKPKTLELRVFDLEHLLKPKEIWEILKIITKDVIRIYKGDTIEAIPNGYLHQDDSLEKILNIYANGYDLKDYEDELDWAYLQMFTVKYSKWLKTKKYMFKNGKLQPFFEKRISNFEYIKEVI